MAAVYTRAADRDRFESCIAPSSRKYIAKLQRPYDAKQPDKIKMVGDTGLEPVTPSVSSWCSSQLS